MERSFRLYERKIHYSMIEIKEFLDCIDIIVSPEAKK